MHDHEHSTDPTNSIRNAGAKIRVQTPGEFLATVPALFGFHPKDSLVAVLLDDRSHDACALRVDLPLAFTGLVLDRLMSAAEMAQACTAVIVVYARHEPCDPAPPYSRKVDDLVTQLEETGVVVRETMITYQGRFWFYGCRDF